MYSDFSTGRIILGSVLHREGFLSYKFGRYFDCLLDTWVSDEPWILAVWGFGLGMMCV